MPALVAEIVVKEFPRVEGALRALGPVSLQVEKGEFVAIVGPSGCGKTTLLRIAHGLARATSGRVLVGGVPVERPGPQRGFVFQQDALLPWRTVRQNVEIGLELMGVSPGERRRRAERWIALVGLAEFADAYPRALSGGMRQRVNLARALIVDPEILLLDEPFAALDAQTREFMQAELVRICEEAGRTALFITHQIDEAIYLADRVLVLSARPGRILDEIKVPFPRPRLLRVKRTPPFLEIEDRIWSLIEAEVRGGASR